MFARSEGGVKSREKLANAFAAIRERMIEKREGSLSERFRGEKGNTARGGDINGDIRIGGI